MQKMNREYTLKVQKINITSLKRTKKRLLKAGIGIIQRLKSRISWRWIWPIWQGWLLAKKCLPARKTKMKSICLSEFQLRTQILPSIRKQRFQTIMIKTRYQARTFSQKRSHWFRFTTIRMRLRRVLVIRRRISLKNWCNWKYQWLERSLNSLASISLIICRVISPISIPWISSKKLKLSKWRKENPLRWTWNSK